jgi:TetR/AcrR family transcriptional regulator, fatty acid metabolism regulator protein
MPYRQSKKSQLRKDNRKNELLKASAAVFSTKGYHRTTVKEITDMAGMSVGTFYLYYRSKEDIFITLYDEMWKYICSLIAYAQKGDQDSPSRVLARVIAAELWGYRKYKSLSKIMMIEAIGSDPRFMGKFTAIMQQSIGMVKQVFSRLQEKNAVEIADVSVASIAYIGAVNNVITCWLLANEDFDLNGVALPLIVFLLQAINADFESADIRRVTSDIMRDLDDHNTAFKIFQSQGEF